MCSGQWDLSLDLKNRNKYDTTSTGVDGEKNIEEALTDGRNIIIMQIDIK